jgi:Putative Ig domain/Squalene-hopene cyclase C-terminal domain
VRLQRVLAPAAFVFCATSVLLASPIAADAAAPSLPQPVSAQAGASWLAGQFNPQGYIPSQSEPGTADLSATANGILALASANVGKHVAATALSYMESNVNTYVVQDGSDGPGQLAILILDAHALGVSPTSFGGTNLVARLLATEEVSGHNSGLFGTKSQVQEFLAGVFDQGLALAALAAASETHGSAIASADSWLLHQQCPDGGWTSYKSKKNPCDGSPADYEGPDTNSTALAIEGLSAQGDLSGTHESDAHAFLVDAQDSDGGWGYEPNAPGAPGSTDPDSTALVLQAVLALGDSPSKAPFVKKADPVSVLESFQENSGADAGSFTFPGVSGADLLATYQAVPAVAGVVLPFNLFVTSGSPPSGAVGKPYDATLGADGGNPPYTWSVEKGFGNLPSGLTLNASTGVISGTPQTAGSFTFVAKVTDTETTLPPRHHNVGWAFVTITVSGT